MSTKNSFKFEPGRDLLFDHNPAADLSRYKTIIDPIVAGVVQAEKGLVGEEDVRTLTREIVLKVVTYQPIDFRGSGRDGIRIGKTIESIVRRQVGIEKEKKDPAKKKLSVTKAAEIWASILLASGDASSSESYWIEEDIAGLESIEEDIGRQMFEKDRKLADKVIKKYLKSVE